MYKDLIDQWKSYDDNDIIMVNHLLVHFNKMAKGIRKIKIINKRILGCKTHYISYYIK